MSNRKHITIAEIDNRQFPETMKEIDNRKPPVPPIPNVLRKKNFDLNHPPVPSDREETGSDDSDDVCNDPVYNFEYECWEQFEDENVAASNYDDNEDEDVDPDGSREDPEGDEFEDKDEGRHTRMSHEDFNCKKRKHAVITTDAYPVSAYDPGRNVLEGNAGISIQNPLHGNSGFSKSMTFSEAQCAYVFGNPTVNSSLDRYLTETSATDNAVNMRYNSEKAKGRVWRGSSSVRRREETHSDLGQCVGQGPNGMRLQDQMEVLVHKPPCPGSKALTKDQNGLLLMGFPVIFP